MAQGGAQGGIRADAWHGVVRGGEVARGGELAERRRLSGAAVVQREAGLPRAPSCLEWDRRRVKVESGRAELNPVASSDTAASVIVSTALSCRPLLGVVGVDLLLRCKVPGPQDDDGRPLDAERRIRVR